MIVRALHQDDLNKGFLDLLSQLRPPICKMDESCFGKIFSELRNSGTTHIFVIEEKNRIVATATIVYCTKFIYGGKALGQIEDVVVHRRFRNRGFGSALIDYCVKHASNSNCFKIGLCSRTGADRFYNACGFKPIGSYFAKYDIQPSESNPKIQLSINTHAPRTSKCFPKNYLD